MAEKELYDYLSTATPDYDATLQVSPQDVLTEMVDKNQVVHEFDDGSNRVVALDDDPIFHVRLRWSFGITKSDSGTILDFYVDTDKANGMARTFKWDHIDGHSYVVRFRSSLDREWFESSTHHRIPEVLLKIVGKV